MIWFFAVWLVLAVLFMFLDFANQGEDTAARVGRDLMIIGLIIYIIGTII